MRQSCYWRIMPVNEGKAVRSTQTVQPNVETWECADRSKDYAPGTVVFLFDSCQPCGRVNAKSFAKTRLSQEGAIAILRIDSELPVQRDCSAVPGFGIVVHIGAINLLPLATSLCIVCKEEDVHGFFA